MNLKSFQNKLIDLSRTNNLINFKDSLYTSVSVMRPDIDKVYQRLLSDEVFDIFNVDKYVTKFSGQEDYSKTNISYDKLLPQISKNIGSSLLLYKKNASINQILKNLARKQKEALDEKGLNVLYMSFGMVSYEEDGNKYQAPLVLVPVKIISYGKNNYRIGLYEEEITVNQNLKYKILNDFKIKLNDISFDDNISDYINYFNETLKKTKFKCNEEVYIALFSFSKIKMYLDILENENIIKKNNIVLSLLNEAKLENKNNAVTSDPITIVDCDNTQLEALEAVRRGESIVLQGPPGTGKSQTITNIISSAIYDGKKVLFVSEKLAALNVVYDKLKNNGLEEFLLALHSTKTNKKEVIKNLYDTLFSEKVKTSSKAKKTLNDTKGIENILDDYANNLHKKIKSYGLTPYEIFTNYSNAIKYKNDCGIIKNADLNYYNSVVDLLNDYKTYLNILDYDYRETPFYLIKIKKFDKKNQKYLENAKNELSIILKNITDINKLYGININNINEYKIFYDADNLFIKSPYYIKELSSKRNIELYKELVNDAIKYDKKIKENNKKLNNYFNESIYDEDIDLFIERLEYYKNKIFKSLRHGYRKVVSNLSKHSNKKIKCHKALNNLLIVKDNKEYLVKYNEIINKLNDITNNKFDSFDLNLLYKTLNEISNIMKINNYKFFKINKDYKLPIYNGIDDIKDIYNLDTYNYDIKKLFILINKTINNYKYVDSYELFENNILNKLKEIDAIKYLDYALDKNIDINNITKPFEYSYYNSLVDYVLNNIPVFRTFNNLIMNKNVSEYIDADHKRIEIYKTIIKEKIQSNRPSPDEIAHGSLAAMIKREFAKKRRQMTVREILNTDFEFVKILKPVIFMSPLSVSSFLEANNRFDLVIFDEASQVYPEDALGAIYRADQVVICGDSKQMPPTNFFKSNIEDDEVDSVSDFESILDMSSSVLNVYSLKWHYRSKCEELIAFSNKYIYDSSLTTFPSAKKHSEDFGLELYNIKGIYDRDKRYNAKEADEVIRLIDEHYKKYGNKRSIGVVAFSISQQHLIEKKYQEYLDKNPFVDNEDEPIFIKNLETVQGDERDTIIFSIGYGFDKDKKFVQNFGPLNRDGGERRLNVAISRAKINVKVVSSITSNDIKDSNVLGVNLLKKYLSFASNPNVRELSIDDDYIDFSSEVRDFLISEGYEVEYMVGYSNQKIDIAIIDKNTGNYSVAIECDGKTYYDSRACRDRNRLREEILTRLGFKYIRVYSTGWFKDKELSKKLLIDEINKTADNLTKMVKEEFFVSEVVDEKAFDEYIHSPDEEIIELYKNNSIDFEALIKRILDNESPISEEWLLSRYKNIFDTSVSINDEYELMKAMNLDSSKIISKNGYLMYKNQRISLRIPYPGSEPRDINYISPIEIAYGMKDILIKNNGLKKEDLFKHLQFILGYKRMSKQIEERFEQSLIELNNITIIKNNKDKIEILDI